MGTDQLPAAIGPKASQRLQREDTVLLVVDVQERLLPVIHEAERVVANTVLTIRGAKALGIPVVVTEQYPQGLGATTSAVIEALSYGSGPSPIAKTTFSCCQSERVRERLDQIGRSTLLLVGIETHVCVAQTAVDAVALGFNVHVLTDAVSSRTAENREIGLARMREAGVVTSSVEMALLELLGQTGTPEFKEILALIK